MVLFVIFYRSMFFSRATNNDVRQIIVRRVSAEFCDKPDQYAKKLYNGKSYSEQLNK